MECLKQATKKLITETNAAKLMTEEKRVATTDEQLMVMVVQGNRKAFFILAERWNKPIINFFYRNVSHLETAEDLAQEVFIKVWNTKNYHPKAPFYSWIYTIARHKLIDFYRKKKHTTVSIEDNKDMYQIPSSYEKSIENRLITELEIEQVKKALAMLPEEQRMAIILSKYQKLSVEDIAKVMNCSVSAAKVRVFRAVKGLIQRFKEIYGNER